MITFPCAKINLGLNIVSKRADGYHNLETVFYPIPLTDALEIKLMGEEFPNYIPNYRRSVMLPFKECSVCFFSIFAIRN